MAAWPISTSATTSRQWQLRGHRTVVVTKAAAAKNAVGTTAVVIVGQTVDGQIAVAQTGARRIADRQIVGLQIAVVLAADFVVPRAVAGRASSRRFKKSSAAAM